MQKEIPSKTVHEKLIFMKNHVILETNLCQIMVNNLFCQLFANLFQKHVSNLYTI